MDRLSPIQGEDDEQELRIPFKIKGGGVDFMTYGVEDFDPKLLRMKYDVKSVGFVIKPTRYFG